MIRARHSLFVLFCLLCAGPALAQAPEVLPYQGYLTDAEGMPVDGNVAMTFRMYESSDSASPSWEETWDNVPVSDGMFVAYLGQYTPITDGVLDTTTRYLGIEIGSDGEAQPRQRVGAVAYSIYARDAYYFRGYGPDYFVTDQELADYAYVDADDVRVLIAEEGGGGEIDLDGYVTDAELAEALAGLGETYVTVEDIDARNYVTVEDIDARNYVNEGDLENYVTHEQLDARVENYIDGDELAAAIADYITQADMVAYLEDNNYVRDGDLDALRERIAALEGRADGVDTRIDGVDTRIDQLEADLNGRIDDLAARIDAIANATQPYVLGRSAATSRGQFSFGGVTGIKAAQAMCVAAYPNEPTAHLCTPGEAQQAIAMGRYSGDNADAFDGQQTWTISGISRSAARNSNDSLEISCLNFLYRTAHRANGVTLEVDLDYQTPDGVNGDVVRLRQEVACGTDLPVLCCR